MNGKKSSQSLFELLRWIMTSIFLSLFQVCNLLEGMKQFPGSGPNPVHSETGGWQTDVCSPQLQFCLSGWIKSSNSDIMSQMSEQRAESAHGAAERPSLL